LREGAAEGLAEALVQRLADALANALGQIFPKGIGDAPLNSIRHLLGIESPTEQALLDERRAKGTTEVPPQRIVEALHDDGLEAIAESLAHTVANLLGHTVAQTTQRYAGVAQDPRREAAERIGERLALLLSPPEKPARVVPMRKRRRRG